MDFGALPPEINSARMYSGPGSSPMAAAAAAWGELADELYFTAASYRSLLGALMAGSWLGPASAAMAQAVAPYVAWMAVTAAQAEQTAAQAGAAAAAYETAFAMTVPPPAIAANRTLLMSLIATNLLGQNSPAIAATEAQYGEMWAQDAAAMFGYAGASASAAQVDTFTTPPPVADPTALGAQGAAVIRASTAAASTDTQAVLSQMVLAMPTALQQLTSPLSSSSVMSTLSSLNPFLSATSSAGWISSALLSNANQLQNLAPAVAKAAGALPASSGLASAGGLGSAPLGTTAGVGSAVSVGTGRAASIGALSVPPSWAVPAPALSPGAAALTGAGLGAGVAAEAGQPASVLGGLPVASLEGRAGTGMVPDARFLERPAMVPRWWGPE